MTDSPEQVALGGVQTLIGSLEFTFVFDERGDAHIQIYATDPASASKGGVLVMLDAAGYERLKAVVRNADSVIDRMIAGGRVKRMVLPY